MILSETEVCKIICPNETANTCRNYGACPEVSLCRSIAKAQHKADQEDFQKQKQEMFKEIETFACNRDCVMGCRNVIFTNYCLWWTQLKEKYDSTNGVSNE